MLSFLPFLTAEAQPSAPAIGAVAPHASHTVFAPLPAGVVRPRLTNDQPLLSAPNGQGEKPGLQTRLSGERWPGSAVPRFQDKAQSATWFAPLASLIVPGTGQAMLRQQRSLGYVVAEAFLVLRSMRAYRDDQNARDHYRELAANVARAAFGPNRPDGPWNYYEEMEKYEASGVYSSAASGQTVPETDPATYNGRQWDLARNQYWANPAAAEDSAEYLRALRYYESRAVKDDFRWSWRDHKLEQEAFRETIKESNNSNQQFVTTVGLLAANHLVSLVDAYVTVRLRRYGGAGLASANLNTKLVPMGSTVDRRYGMAMSVTIPVAGLR